jgi:hypothetical protein
VVLLEAEGQWECISVVVVARSSDSMGAPLEAHSGAGFVPDVESWSSTGRVACWQSECQADLSSTRRPVAQNVGCLSCFADVPLGASLASSGRMVQEYDHGLTGVPLTGVKTRVIQSSEHGRKLETWWQLTFRFAQSRWALVPGNGK